MRANYHGTNSAEEPTALANEWMRDWMRTKIADAIALLPSEQREVFVRHELEGESFDQIAKDTGAGINTLLSRKRWET